MKQCPICQNGLETIKMKCGECEMIYESTFTLPRLMRLPPDHLKLAEAFLLCGGNIKELSTHIGISYPTLRKQIDAMIEELTKLRREDDKTIDTILKNIEQGKMKAEHGLRIIKELNGEH